MAWHSAAFLDKTCMLSTDLYACPYVMVAADMSGTLVSQMLAGVPPLTALPRNAQQLNALLSGEHAWLGWVCPNLPQSASAFHRWQLVGWVMPQGVVG